MIIFVLSRTDRELQFLAIKKLDLDHRCCNPHRPEPDDRAHEQTRSFFLLRAAIVSGTTIPRPARNTSSSPAYLNVPKKNFFFCQRIDDRAAKITGSKQKGLYPFHVLRRIAAGATSQASQFGPISASRDRTPHASLP